MNGYRCSCGEGIFCYSLREAKKIHAKTHSPSEAEGVNHPVKKEQCECKEPVRCVCKIIPFTHCATCKLLYVAPSPRPDGWEERFDKKLNVTYCGNKECRGHIGNSSIEVLEKIKDFIRQELLSTRQEDAKAFRGMIGEDECKELVGLHAHYTPIMGIKNKLRAEIRSKLSKFEEEQT